MENMIKFCEPTMQVVLTAKEGEDSAKLKVILHRIRRSEAKEILAADPSFDSVVADFFARVVEYPEVESAEGGTKAYKATDQTSTFAEITDLLLDSQVWCRAAFEAYIRTLHGLPDVIKEADLGN